MKSQNRKIESCPLCGREEKIAEEKVLVMCGRCAMLRSEAYARKNENVDMTKKLKDTMKARNVSARHIAHELKISKSLVNAMLNGKRSINTKVYKWMEK